MRHAARQQHQYRHFSMARSEMELALISSLIIFFLLVWAYSRFGQCYEVRLYVIRTVQVTFSKKFQCLHNHMLVSAHFFFMALLPLIRRPLCSYEFDTHAHLSRRRTLPKEVLRVHFLQAPINVYIMQYRSSICATELTAPFKIFFLINANAW